MGFGDRPFSEEVQIASLLYHYKKQNAVTDIDSYHIQRMDDCLDWLVGAPILLTLDANSIYWHTEIIEWDKDKTTFTPCQRLYGFSQMPLGLKNRQSSIQREIDVILTTVNWQLALRFLADVVIFSIPR